MDTCKRFSSFNKNNYTEFVRWIPLRLVSLKLTPSLHKLHTFFAFLSNASCKHSFFQSSRYLPRDDPRQALLLPGGLARSLITASLPCRVTSGSGTVQRPFPRPRASRTDQRAREVIIIF
jgi:hypothetical protein